MAHKSVVYIDGQNSLYKAAEFLIKINAITDKQELIKIDFRYILETLFPNTGLEIKYFGVGKIKKQEKYGDKMLNKSIIFADNLRRLKNYLDKINIKFFGIGNLQVRNRDECEKCGFIGYKMAEKGVDVGMAVEIVRDSFDKNIEEQIVVSSDIDLLPAIKAAKQNNKKFYYVAFKGKVIHAISYYAEETKCIDGSLILEAFVRALKR